MRYVWTSAATPSLHGMRDSGKCNSGTAAAQQPVCSLSGYLVPCHIQALARNLHRSRAGAFAAATNQTLDLEKLDLRMEPGDVLAVALQTASSTATTNVSLNWHEE